MLYVHHKQEPPNELYYLRLRSPRLHNHDRDNQPHKNRREISNSLLNALIYDEQGKLRQSDVNLKFLGLSHQQLRIIVYERNPVFKLTEQTDTGHYLQFLYSKIAKKIILKLMPRGIVALPLHDPFLLRQELLPQLTAAMLKAFDEVTGANARRNTHRQV